MTAKISLAELLADPGSSAPAIIAISPLAIVSYKALAEQIERLAAQLRNARLKPGECVAIVLPNSLEFLVVFLALTCARLVAAPLNPADKADEIRFFIEDARAQAVVAEGANVAVREATAGLGLPIWQPRVDSRGVVELPELPPASRTSIDAPKPDDVCAICLYQWHHGPAQVRAAYPRQHALVIVQYRRTLCPDLRRLQPGGIAAVPRSRFDRRHVVDVGVRRLRNRTAALFSLRVLETVPRASRDLVFCRAYYSSGAPGKSGQRRRAPQRPTIHPLVFGCTRANNSDEH